MTFDDYIELAEESYWKSHPGYRKGQTYFNICNFHRPDITQNLVGTSVDPFYDDKILPAFLEIVAQRW